MPEVIIKPLILKDLHFTPLDFDKIDHLLGCFAQIIVLVTVIIVMVFIAVFIVVKRIHFKTSYY